LQSTGVAVEVAVSAALPASGKANTLVNRAPYIQALELRIFMVISPLVWWSVPGWTCCSAVQEPLR
jgi:hypothetical protein